MSEKKKFISVAIATSLAVSGAHAGTDPEAADLIGGTQDRDQEFVIFGGNVADPFPDDIISAPGGGEMPDLIIDMGGDEAVHGDEGAAEDYYLAQTIYGGVPDDNIIKPKGLKKLPKGAVLKPQQGAQTRGQGKLKPGKRARKLK